MNSIKNKKLKYFKKRKFNFKLFKQIKSKFQYHDLLWFKLPNIKSVNNIFSAILKVISF